MYISPVILMILQIPNPRLWLGNSPSSRRLGPGFFVVRGRRWNDSPVEDLHVRQHLLRGPWLQFQHKPTKSFISSDAATLHTTIWEMFEYVQKLPFMWLSSVVETPDGQRFFTSTQLPLKIGKLVLLGVSHPFRITKNASPDQIHLKEV